MAKKNIKTKAYLAMEKRVATFLKTNPEIKKTLKVFNMNLSEYTSAIKSNSQAEPFINFKNTEWLPGKK